MFQGEDSNHMLKIGILIMACGLALLIGILRYITGPEYALSLVYLFPVTFVSWYMGTRAGICISAVCTLSWLTADLAMVEQFSGRYIPFMNEAFRLIVFIIIAIVIGKLQFANKTCFQHARTDALTGISNRRKFFECVNSEMDKARRFSHPISILFMDVDNFKAINDSYGHDSGDALLCDVANTLKMNVRIVDTVARLGGDEFGILLPETGVAASYWVATKLQDHLVSLAGDKNWPVAFSMGLATFEQIPDNAEKMVRKADYLMYQAKKDDSNKVCRKTF